jgi:hypothetical protein
LYYILTAGLGASGSKEASPLWRLRALPRSEARSYQEPRTSHRLATNALRSSLSLIRLQKELSMAKALFIQQTGALGAVVYQGGRHGTITRARVIPTNPQTNLQQNVRSILAAVASEWRGLTDPVRAGWKALAAQLPSNPTGFQAYTKVNCMLVSCGMPKLEVAPLMPAFGILSSTGLVVDDTPGVKLTQVADTVAPDKFILEATPPLPAGLSSIEVLYRRLTVLAGHAGPAVDLDLTAAYSAKFGAPVAGQRVFVRITPMKDGFRGIPRAYSALVAAQGA